MELNLIKVSFAFITFLVVVLGALVSFFSPYIPDFISQIYRYGKFGFKGKSQSLQLPKSWFKHFYVFASVISLSGLLLLEFIYFILGKAPNQIIDFLDFWCGSNRVPTVSAAACLTATLLLTLQSWKRMYETFCVSVFSSGKIDASHYFLGFYHYFGAIVAILSEAPGFTRETATQVKEGFHFQDITLPVIIASVILLTASREQLKAATILADLRKDKQGTVVSYKHKVPSGGLFEYISSPHLACEIVIYTCLTALLWGNTTWLYVYLWVVSNQISTGMLTHWWYKSEFKNYPTQRKALIPFIL